MTSCLKRSLRRLWRFPARVVPPPPVVVYDSMGIPIEGVP
jgi:hypothetical protein